MYLLGITRKKIQVLFVFAYNECEIFESILNLSIVYLNWKRSNSIHVLYCGLYYKYWLFQNNLISNGKSCPLAIVLKFLEEMLWRSSQQASPGSSILVWPYTTTSVRGHKERRKYLFSCKMALPPAFTYLEMDEIVKSLVCSAWRIYYCRLAAAVGCRIFINPVKDFSNSKPLFNFLLSYWATISSTITSVFTEDVLLKL